MNCIYSHNDCQSRKTVKLRRVVTFMKYLFLNCYFAAPRPTLGHYRGRNLIYQMLITGFIHIFDPKVTGTFVTRLGPKARPSA